MFKAASPCSHSYNCISLPDALRSQEKFIFSVHSLIAMFLLPPPAADGVAGPWQRTPTYCEPPFRGLPRHLHAQS